MGINRVFIVGNLTRDAELRQTPSGTAVLSIGVCVNDRRKNGQTGQWEDVPNFVDCTMFGKRAEALAPILRKGMKVSIEGRLHWSSWQDRGTGAKRSKLDVTVDEVELPQRQQQGGYQTQQPQQAPQPVQGAPAQDPYANEDIPFDGGHAHGSY